MERFRIAVLISGGGTTLKNLLDFSSQGRLDVEFGLVVSSRKAAKGLEYASEAGIPCRHIARRDFDVPEAHSEAMFSACRELNIDLVVMGGYLEHLLIPPDFENRVVNIHPSLIPAFCGKGFYGRHVHASAIEFGAKLSGCTVHFVDNEFDHGPIIAQQACPILPDDSPESLAQRVFELECKLLPITVAAIAEGRVQVLGRSVSLQPNDE